MPVNRCEEGTNAFSRQKSPKIGDGTMFFTKTRQTTIIY